MQRLNIRNQWNQYSHQACRDENLTILRRHAIEFDERYVFDEEIIG